MGMGGKWKDKRGWNGRRLKGCERKGMVRELNNFGGMEGECT